MDRRTAAALGLAVGLLGGCGESKPPQGGIGQQTADIASDTKVMAEVNAAANEVIRNSTDCAVVKATLPEATMKIQDAIPRTRTAAGRQTIEALQKQLKAVGDSCP